MRCAVRGRETGCRLPLAHPHIDDQEDQLATTCRSEPSVSVNRHPGPPGEPWFLGRSTASGAARTSSQPLTTSPGTSTSGRTEARVRIRQPPPAKLALIVGDAVHNMRAALDHAVFDTAYRHSGGRLSPRDEENLMMPIIGDGTKADFAKTARRRLPHIPKLVRDVIEEEQPFAWNT